MTDPYWTDGNVALYLGDCLSDLTAWLDADVMVTDPPYGRSWRQGQLTARRNTSGLRHGIQGDRDTTVRDEALTRWGGERPAVVFGDLLLPPPPLARLAAVYAKPGDAGVRGAVGGVRRDVEGVYLLGGGWGSGIGGRSAVFTTARTTVGNPGGIAARSGGHPHAKPLDVMEALIDLCPRGTIADPFAGSGSTLVAAKALGRAAVGVEVEERYAEMAARRLAQDPLLTV